MDNAIEFARKKLSVTYFVIIENGKVVNEFILLFLTDGILCIVVLVIISQFFTGKLANHIMKPLNALSDGAERIRNHDLTRDIEFEIMWETALP